MSYVLTRLVGRTHSQFDTAAFGTIIFIIIQRFTIWNTLFLVITTYALPSSINIKIGSRNFLRTF